MSCAVSQTYVVQPSLTDPYVPIASVQSSMLAAFLALNPSTFLQLVCVVAIVHIARIVAQKPGGLILWLTLVHFGIL